MDKPQIGVIGMAVMGKAADLRLQFSIVQVGRQKRLLQITRTKILFRVTRLKILSTL